MSGGVLLALAVIAVALLWVARVKAPTVYWSLVGLPAALYRVLASYRQTMEACELTVAPPWWRVFAKRATSTEEPRPGIPKIRGIRPTRTGLRLRLRLAAGLEPDDVVKSAVRLRHAWGVYSVHVTELRPGVIELRMTGFDILARVRMPRRLAVGPLSAVVALREDGLPFVRDFQAVPHSLTLGANKSGKSMYQRCLIKALAPLDVALVGIDCKRGVEQTPFGPRLSALATTPDAASELLDALVSEMEARFDLLCLHQGIAPGTPLEDITSDIWDLPKSIRPVPIVVLVDEIAELFLTTAKADTARRDRMVTQLVRLAQLARAVAIHLEICGQRFGTELGRGATALRAQLTGRIVHRCNDRQTAEMGLADVNELAVAAATSIPAERAGLAIAGDASGGWSRIRTPKTSLGEAAAVCREFAHITPHLPALAPWRPEPSEPVEALAPEPATATA
ncbi:FtsK/SpoIIIE domain-containing protein [Streptomyces wuyuanensis]|uniref:DNA segregation ATPase FtsK/SpoIIIE, S-DNA-T family n=1 Tax=Streptomyces wuyuanensis TaxID=1196353 RepID=A0A1H0E555_9ACTN|nr:FtsK/SpoIIIE domain-containing protein [Streptomyces wuyuanensis]SDN77584.1 DNA segregation ATPase FtsK/SpoIIIE, S-DNA-T family [Streptomyces wuyuanensis]